VQEQLVQLKLGAWVRWPHFQRLPAAGGWACMQTGMHEAAVVPCLPQQARMEP
jgi:hypothetical protein